MLPIAPFNKAIAILFALLNHSVVTKRTRTGAVKNKMPGELAQAAPNTNEPI
jgi:hypothetical protein